MILDFIVRHPALTMVFIVVVCLAYNELSKKND